MKTTRLRRGFTATSVAAVLLGAGLGCRNDPPVEVNKLSPGEKPPAPPALVAAGTPPPPAPAVLEPAPPPASGGSLGASLALRPSPVPPADSAAISPARPAPTIGDQPTSPLAGGLQAPANAGTDHRRLSVNGLPLDRDQMMRVATLESQYGYQTPNGDYWYDNTSGLWGQAGGPAMGYLPAGLALGGPLPADASGGGSGSLTGVFLNGREIHPQDLTQIQLLTPVEPGRHWLDAQGNLGREGWPAAVNLWALVQQRMSAGGSQGGAWSHSQWTPQGNNYVGGDGSFTYFMGSDGQSVYIDH